MKVTLNAVCLFVFAVLLPTLFPAVEILGVMPNLFLVYVIIAGFFVRPENALRIGVVSGFVYDILAGHAFGFNTVMYMLVCLFVSLFYENMIRRINILLIALSVVLGTFIFEGIYGFFVYFLNGGVEFLQFLKELGIEAFYNAVIAFILYLPLKSAMTKVYSEKGDF